jgi:hypothetical protein
LHGAANEVLARHDTQEYWVCIVVRAPSASLREQSADRASIADLEGRFGKSARCVQCEVDTIKGARDTRCARCKRFAFFDIEIGGTNEDGLLKAAAYALASGDIQDDAKRMGVDF